VVAEYRQGVLDREYVYQGGALLASDEQPRTCTMTTDQYVRNFYTGALARQPNATELQQWTTAIDQALAQGYGAVLGEVRNLGTALFTSQEYLNRNRTNSEFIIDLYWGYLHRTYDQGGYDGWLATLNGGATREQVRAGFALSSEFENNAAVICTTLGSTAAVKYVFMDHQGSTRAVLNGSGNVVARHDYLLFGEELWAGVGMRTTAQQFGAMDQSRNRYALTEKDEGTGLDHTWFRKYENSSGRWTTPDPLGGSLSDPQSFNRYNYTTNDPLNLIDPSGLLPCVGAQCSWSDVSAGYWGAGDLNNRLRTKDWALEDKRTQWQCPPGRICFLEPMGDNWFKLWIIPQDDIIFKMSPELKRLAQQRQRARNEFNDCVNKNPKMEEYNNKHSTAAALSALPIPGAIGLAKSLKNWRSGAPLRSARVTGPLVSGAVFTLLMNQIEFDVEVDRLYKELRKDWDDNCVKQIKDKYGIEIPRFR
jgi:RHS repeat-associated protein